MNLKDASKKMSKSELSDYSRINLTDDPELIFDKIKKAKTDSIAKVSKFHKKKKIKYDANRPEMCNLIRIY